VVVVVVVVVAVVEEKEDVAMAESGLFLAETVEEFG